MRIRVFLCMVIVPLLLAACVGLESKLSEGSARRLKHIHIVAMEPLPLRIPGDFSKLYRPTSVGGNRTVQAVESVLAIGSLLLAAPNAQSHAEQTSHSIESYLNVPTPWIATLALAHEAQTLLRQRGMSADLAPSVEPFADLTDRSYTLSMDNWLGPINDWYQDPGLQSGNQALAKIADALVMEVALSDYRLRKEKLHLRVLVRLIDPKSGEIIGRASASNDSSPADLTVSNEPLATRFKMAFARASRQLLTQCLRELGLGR